MLVVLGVDEQALVARGLSLLMKVVSLATAVMVSVAVVLLLIVGFTA